MAEDTRFTPRRGIPGRDARLLRAAGGFGKRARIVPVAAGAGRTRGWRPSATAGGMVLAAVLVAGALAWQPVSLWAFGAISRAAPGAAVSIRFHQCAGASDTNCVIDGDTVRFSGMTVRIADIDTPETRDYGCASEKALGDRATRRMRELLNAGPFTVGGYPRDEDVYGRKLRILTRDGVSLGEMLVAEGLARKWDGARHPWC